ncbi:helix-turn-helix transcriptional regulator [Actinomadura luteofluorescens]|uniref:Putative DNA-binding transcriptional regulator YafY n=1 Tax=Actinomadura luteofluorescens TaxID=46163 RepID=A0A7Y9EKK3_9ACTN|nr:WYL domain-containing protein [Actinomadura luteofluorescens]NYD49276.1 putative DNA-binding transcriptional regulator YafY [Actinomadura luteofluorescens]
MMRTSVRLLRLLSLLQARRDWTGPELAERLDVTTRTVRNDVERLRELGYPVDATPGVGGGYSLGTAAVLPPLLFDDEEAVAVAIGLRTAATGAVSGIEEASVRALAKLERLLPSRLRHRIGTLASTTVALPGSGPSVDASVLTAIAAACRDHERLRFGYRTHGGAEGHRVTEPHRLVASGRRWYLLAWDLERDDWRTFRVDRIVPRPPAGPRFTPRDMPDEDVAARISSGLAQAMWAYRARVVVNAPATEIAARVPAGITVEPAGDDTCVVEVGSDDPSMLTVYLGMLDADFQIDETANPELADTLRILAARYTRATDARP